MVTCNVDCIPTQPPATGKTGALDPSNNRNRCLEIWGAAGASNNYALKGLLAHWNFSIFNLMLSRPSRIIVEITSGSVFRTLSSGEQKSKFAHQARFLVHITRELNC